MQESSYGALRLRWTKTGTRLGRNARAFVSGDHEVRADWEASVMPDFSNWIFINNYAWVQRCVFERTLEVTGRDDRISWQ
ncbi:MAG: hypothetical protein JWO71_4138 [Candidatus Acidoferrum typicum]|nr:hypothetical protein [Candidatus Acidoferrum typicum]